MTGPVEDAWEYLKRAPLGVVLAVSLVCTGFSVAYTAKVSSDDRRTAKDAGDRADRSEAAAKTAEQKAAVAAAADAQTLAALERVERALQKLTAEVAAASALMQQHVESHKDKRAR